MLVLGGSSGSFSRWSGEGRLVVVGWLWRDGGRMLVRLRGLVVVAAAQLLSRVPIAVRSGKLPTLSSRHSRAEERVDSSPVAALGIDRLLAGFCR